MKKTFALGALTAMALVGSAYSEIEATFNVGWNSTYVWRGQDLGDNGYQYGIDVSDTSEDLGIDWAAGIWYINPSDDEANDELNIYASVSKDFGGVTATLGFIHYEFDDTVDADNTEIYASLGTAFCGIDLSATFYQVIDGDLAGNPSYGEVAASYGYDISDKLSASLGFTFGTVVEADESDNYITYNLNLGFDYAASENVTVSPYVAYNSTSNLSGITPFTGVYGGVILNYSF